MSGRSTASPHGRHILLLSVLVSALILVQQVNAESVDIVLLVQQTPKGAGIITPDPGTHRFALNSEITIIATPKPGYEFLYWLGDVTNAKSNRTTVLLEKPKIVIAIFGKVEEHIITATGGGSETSTVATASFHSRAVGGISSSSSLVSKPTDLSSPGSVSSGSRKISRSGQYSDIIIPPPIPEPATVTLMLVGGAFILRKKRVSR